MYVFLSHTALGRRGSASGSTMAQETATPSFATPPTWTITPLALKKVSGTPKLLNFKICLTHRRDTGVGRDFPPRPFIPPSLSVQYSTALPPAFLLSSHFPLLSPLRLPTPPPMYLSHTPSLLFILPSFTLPQHPPASASPSLTHRYPHTTHFLLQPRPSPLPRHPCRLQPAK